MRLDVEFKQLSQRFDTDFGEVLTAPGAIDAGVEDSLVTRTLTEYSNDRVTSIGDSAFRACAKLKSVDFPNATFIGSYAFHTCTSLEAASFPLATRMDSYAFYGCSSMTSVDFPYLTGVNSSSFQGCSSLTEVHFPLSTSFGGSAFNGCTALATAELPKAASINNLAFQNCYSLTAVVIGYDKVCSLAGTGAFNGCHHILGTVDATYNPYGLKDGYIYVPDDLVESYKTATNWKTYASQIKPLSEYDN